MSADEFREETEAAIKLLTKGDHFDYFFTDRDGTLKSYSCSYPASIQPAYSGVIQVCFVVKLLVVEQLFKMTVVRKAPKTASRKSAIVWN